MRSAHKNLLPWIVFLIMVLLSGCLQSKLKPVEENYQYSVKSKYYLCPAVVDGWVEKNALCTINSDGTFFCFTKDTKMADDFINAQRTLLLFLRNCGAEIGQMEYYGTEYEYSFSQSSDKAAYIAVSDVRSWQQVLVTLQTIWGDYTEYGYVYAMSNAIAKELGWQTDSVPSIGKDALDAFFVENPDVINLLYPTFTTKFASEETVGNSKALAVRLFEKIRWKKALGKPADAQLDDYCSLISAYAQDLSVPFARQSCGYAYYGENIKLRIMTTYAELIIDCNYCDAMESLYGDYWDNYSSIYQTTNTINKEITAAVEYFALEDEAGTIRIKWLDSENNTTKKFIPQNTGAYHSSTQTAYITSIRPYLHEYYHHIEHLINPNLGSSWQSQTFCELGASCSQYVQMTTEHTFSKSEDGIELFRAFTGRTYESGRNDYFEAWDIMCYYNNYYELAYKTGAQAHNSFSRYLINLYEESVVYDLMLFPETVDADTGNTWEELRAEWQQHIRDKYAEVIISDGYK